MKTGDSSQEYGVLGRVVVDNVVSWLVSDDGRDESRVSSTAGECAVEVD